MNTRHFVCGSKMRAILLMAQFAVGAELTSPPVMAEGQPKRSAGVAVRVRLDAPGFATLVIENEKGDRIRNLISETRLPSGESTVYWDGYNEGQRNAKGELARSRVLPGVYRIRGLVHDGISMSYESTVDNPGAPPWSTKDGSGGWLADHSPPADVLHLPEGLPTPNGKGRARFLVCSSSAEAGSEFVWLDAEGRRLYGTNDGFWGGTHLARDPGSRPSSDYSAYVFESGQRDSDNFTLEIRGFRSNNGQLESIIKYPRPKSLRTFKGDEAYGSDGLAAFDGRLVFAVTMLDKLVFVDARKKKVVGETILASPRAPHFDGKGNLYVLSEGKVKRFRVSTDLVKLEAEETLVNEGLEDPRRLSIDNVGNLFVSDWGKSHQIKVFDPVGRHLQTIGKPGGPQIGRYDEQRMAHPCGCAA